jgi:N utilization substance protein B
MISRRNIRVKVMQTLYSVVTSENESDATRLNLPEAQKILQTHFHQTQELLVYLIYFLTEVCRYAETDSHQRSTKHLPTYEDLHVNTKIAGNKTMWRMLEERSYQDALKKIKPQHRCDMELVKKVYSSLLDTPEYKKYISQPERETKEEKEILEFILDKLMLANELFTSHVEELFPNWDDDGELVALLLMNYIQKPGSVNLNELVSQDKKEFAETLLTTVEEKKEYLHSLIIPKLKNWDPERIALLDMILMKMGVSEFLYFETIPPKVTINEYIDLAKEYSTPQSGQFVNGILDNIHKELVQQGKMKKVDYKKS